MTRREFLWSAAAVTAPSAADAPVIVPVRRVVDSRARCTPEEWNRFWWQIWPEAVRDFQKCGIRLQTSDARGEVRRTAGDRPIFAGAERGVINLILTDHLPLYWDNSRALAGVSTIHDGYHLCLMALRYAHGNQVPFLSVNTCEHELLHALMQDVFVSEPKWYQTGGREFRIDALATSMWLFHSGAAVRRSARAYVERLRSIDGAGSATAICPQPVYSRAC